MFVGWFLSDSRAYQENCAHTHTHVNQTKSNWTIYYIKITVLPEKCSLFIQRMYAKNVAHCGIFAMLLFHISFLVVFFLFTIFLFYESKKNAFVLWIQKKTNLEASFKHTQIRCQTIQNSYKQFQMWKMHGNVMGKRDA